MDLANAFSLSLITFALVLGAGANLPAHAAGTAGHGAHQHGHGKLNAAVDGNDLLIELEVPATHAVGFEHAPKNADQEQLVDEALDRIVKLSNWLVVTPADACKMSDYEVELLGEARESGESHDHDHDKHAHEKHDDDKHDHDKHAHEKHDDDKHDHDKHAHEKHDDDKHDDEHSELHAQFHLTCKPDMPAQALDLTIGNVLEGIEELDVTVLAPNVQRSVEVGAGKTTVPLR